MPRATKKVVKKAAKSVKKAVKKVAKKDNSCEDCKGTGLYGEGPLNERTLCEPCKGTGRD